MTYRAGRLQTAADLKKALQQYDALRKTGLMRRAIVIAEMQDGDVHILGQGMTPHEMGPLLMVTAHALAQVEENRKLVRAVAHVEPEKRGEHSGGKPPPRAITTNEDGIHQPPPGENFISCGECAHPTWHVLHYNDTDRQSRMACAHCGNEVVEIPIYHRGGSA